MPRIVIDNLEYVFEYGYTQYQRKRTSIEGTYCIIKCGHIGSKDADKTTIASAIAFQNPKDTPNRRIARTVALKRALDKTNFNSAERAEFFAKIRVVPEALEM